MPAARASLATIPASPPASMELPATLIPSGQAEAWEERPAAECKPLHSQSRSWGNAVGAAQVHNSAIWLFGIFRSKYRIGRKIVFIPPGNQERSRRLAAGSLHFASASVRIKAQTIRKLASLLNLGKD